MGTKSGNKGRYITKVGYLDVVNWLRGEIEGYVHTIQLDFGLNYLDVTSQWDD